MFFMSSEVDKIPTGKILLTTGIKLERVNQTWSFSQKTQERSSPQVVIFCLSPLIIYMYNADLAYIKAPLNLQVGAYMPQVAPR